MKTITPCLWLDREAEQAAAFYLSVFPDSRITAVTRYPDDPESLPGESPGRGFEIVIGKYWLARLVWC